MVATFPTITGLIFEPSVCAATPVVTVTASVLGATHLQWYHQGNSIPGATLSVMSISGINPGLNQVYLQAFNGSCMTRSTVANITIVSNVASVSSGGNALLCPGQNSLLQSSFTGGGSILSYQWYKNGVAIGGANTSSYSISNAAISSTGTYIATAQATCGLAISTGIVVTLDCNNALAINRGDQIVLLPFDAGLNIGTSIDFTYEAWIKYSGNSSGYMGIVTRQGGASFVQFSIVNDRIGGEIFDGGNMLGVGQGLIGTTMVNDGNWHHVAMVVTRASQNAKIYVDGNLEANVNGISVSANLAPNSGIHIGNRRGGGNPMPGVMDDVRIWHVALSQQEIQANRFKILTSSVAGLVAYFDYNQGIPGGNNARLTTLLDRSGNGRNATLTNFTLNGATENWVSANGTTTTTGAYTFSAPIIVATPAFAQGCPGSVALVTISAAGTALSFSWYKDNVLLVGQNGSTLTLSGSNSLVSGNIKAVVSNLGGSSTSSGISFIAECQHALQFNGSGSINLGNLNYVSTGTTGQYTVQVWIYPSAGGDRWIVGDEQVGNGGVGLQLNSGDNRVIAFHTGGLGASSNSVPLNTWSHMVLVQDGTGTHFYLNGVFNNTMFGPSNANLETAFNTYIGAFQGSSRNFVGKIDQLSMWNRALTATEILTNYTRNLTGSESGLVAWYDFNQGVANANNVGATTLINKVNGLNYGTLTGFALNGTTSNWVPSEITLSGTFVLENAEIEILGNGFTISNGDNTPSVLDGTDYGTVSGILTRYFTIQNLGTNALSLTGVPLVSLKGSPDFSVNVFPAPVLAGSTSTTVQISFNSSSVGQKSATVYISSDDSDEGMYSFALTGYIVAVLFLVNH